MPEKDSLKMMNLRLSNTLRSDEIKEKKNLATKRAMMKKEKRKIEEKVNS
jgi:hypothetical protein